MNGRHREVFTILKSISKSNGVPLPETALEMQKGNFNEAVKGDKVHRIDSCEGGKGR